MRGWSLWVPLPPSKPGRPKKWININSREHWGLRNAKTALWREAARMAAEEAQIPTLSKAWVVGYLHFGNRRRRDAANWYPTLKACVDGFTDADLWKDDQDGILTGPDPRRAPDDLLEHRLAKGVRPKQGVTFHIWEVADGD